MNLEKRYIEEKDIENSFFFDTYAIFEILKGNEKYMKYKDSKISLTKLNLFELYSGILREVDEKNAKNELNKYYNFSIDFDKETIEEAAKMKLVLNKRNISMTDCIGYILSKRLGIKFLTGDKEFENLKNVEFVK